MPRSTSFENTIDAAQDGRSTHGISVQAFLASLSISAFACIVQVSAFIFLRDRLKHLYQPRGISEPQDDGRRSGNKSQSWVRKTICTRHTDILEDSGLDAFLFLRYLQFLLKLFVLLAIITLSFVLPFNVVHGKEIAQGVQGLDRLTWASVGSGYQQHYWVHLCVAAVATMCICVSIYKEHLEYIRVRQLYLSSPRFRSYSSDRIVLITAIPRQYASTSALQTIYGELPGGIKSIILNPEPGSLVKKVRQRQTVLEDIEVAMTKAIRRNTMLDNRGGSRLYSEDVGAIKSPDTSKKTPGPGGPRHNLLSVMAEYGKKRSIQRKAQLLSELDTEVRSQVQQKACPRYRSAFIEFHLPRAASLAHQSIACSRPFSFLTHLVGTSNDYILWDNLGKSAWQFYWRSLLSWAIVALTIAGWAIPIAFTGSLSQISYLSSTIPGFTGIGAIPTWLLSPIEGTIPQLLLIILLTCVPVLFRAAALFQGYCTTGDVELAVQRYYFCFLFVQVFLTVSISSSFTTIIRQIYHGVDSVPTMLATNLPKSSNYFLSYLLLQAFSISASRLLRPPGLMKWLLLIGPAKATPRQKWRHEAVLQPAQWGTVFPVFTNLACIAIIFSVIAPLISVLAIATFGTTLFVFKYEVIYISKPQKDTSGKGYPLALNQLFTGVYTMHICVIGLFLLERTPENHLACLPQALLMLAMALMTIVFQVLLSQAFQSLHRSLPLLEQPTQRPRGILERIRDAVRYCVGTRIIAGENQRPAIGEPCIELSTAKRSPLWTNLSGRDSWVVSDSRSAGNPYTDTTQLTLWVPQDPYGFSASMIAQFHRLHPQIRITNEGATVNSAGHLEVAKAPDGIW